MGLSTFLNLIKYSTLRRRKRLIHLTVGFIHFPPITVLDVPPDPRTVKQSLHSSQQMSVINNHTNVLKLLLLLLLLHTVFGGASPPELGFFLQSTMTTSINNVPRVMKYSTQMKVLKCLILSNCCLIKW